MNISGNGKLVAAAYGDGTIRWHRLSDGEELLALFVHAKDRRTIAWTPKGYYAASPGAEDFIGWHVNRGFDTAPDFSPRLHLRQHLQPPGHREGRAGHLSAKSWPRLTLPSSSVVAAPCLPG